MAAKQKKKRNKKYQGSDAKVTVPSVTRVSAEERSRLKEWWLAYGTFARIITILATIALVILLVVIGIIGLL